MVVTRGDGEETEGDVWCTLLNLLGLDRTAKWADVRRRRDEINKLYAQLELKIPPREAVSEWREKRPSASVAVIEEEKKSKKQRARQETERQSEVAPEKKKQKSAALGAVPGTAVPSSRIKVAKVGDVRTAAARTTYGIDLPADLADARKVIDELGDVSGGLAVYAPQDRWNVLFERNGLKSEYRMIRNSVSLYVNPRDESELYAGIPWRFAYIKCHESSNRVVNATMKIIAPLMSPPSRARQH